MNYSDDDRHRSIRRFLMASLGSPPWRVITERRTVKDDERPLGLVEPASAATTTRSRTSMTQGNVERAQTYSVMLYLPVLDEDGERLGSGEARRMAADAATRLELAISTGLVPAIDDDPDAFQWETAPERLPVFDYAGVATSGQRVIPQEHYGWLWVEEYPIRAIQDPDDDVRFTVVSDLRVSWERAGRVPSQTPLVGSMPPQPLFEHTMDLS